MASNTFCGLCGLIIATVVNFYGVNAQKMVRRRPHAGPRTKEGCCGAPVCVLCIGQCSSSEFWNSDMDVCVPCASCKQYPKTPSCNTCRVYVEQTSDVWRLAAITSFSVLAIVLVGAALIIAIMVHRRKSQKRPLREPIEETAGPLYQA